MSSCNANCSTCTSDLRLQEFIKIKNYYSFKEEFNYNYNEYSLPTSIMLGLTDDCNLACSCANTPAETPDSGGVK